MEDVRRIDLPFDSSAPGVARAFVRTVLSDATAVDDLELIASELATNAVLHGAPPITVTIRPTGTLGAAIRLDVTQGLTPDRPGIRTDAEPGTGGYGLRLVAELADDWGTVTTDDALSTWATVNR